MAYATITPQDLIAKFQYALDNNWGYIWGAYGGLWTEAKQKATKNEQAKKYGSKWIGHRVADCSGLFYWAFKELGSFMYHGSNTMFNKYCKANGKLKNGQRTDGNELLPGTAVFVYKAAENNRSHVGLYIGNDTVIEAASTNSGVITSKITNKKWAEWGELRYVDYGYQKEAEPEEAKTQRNLRSGCKGEDVKRLQEMLNEAGYAAGEADGIFGKNTLRAVKSFQASRGLKEDGIAGPMTISALEKAIQNRPITYCVTIPNLTSEEASALIKKYNNATMAPENGD